MMIYEQLQQQLSIQITIELRVHAYTYVSSYRFLYTYHAYEGPTGVSRFYLNDNQTGKFKFNLSHDYEWIRQCLVLL